MGGPDYEFPFTCNVVAEMVEDRVYGDVVNPSPAGRSGAGVKVTTKELGLSVEGREQVELVSSRWTPPRSKVE